MLENINLAFQGVWSHKLRSFLTMLGIIIGIAAIITIVSTIQGTNEQIKQNLIGAGNNVVRVTIGTTDSQNYFDLNYSALPEGIDPVTREMRDEMEKLGSVSLVSMYYSRDWCDNVYVGNTAFSGSLYGVDDHYLTAVDYAVNYGRSFTAGDYENRRNVALIDAKSAKSLFQGENPIGGTIEIKGKQVHIKTPRQAIQHGIAFLTEDRKGQGLVLAQSIRTNLILANMKGFSTGMFLNEKRIEDAGQKNIASLRIKTPSIDEIVGQLSGGNQQKVVIGKWVNTDADIFIFDEPTRGIDVGAKIEVYRVMNDLVKAGKCVIMVSSELPEILAMSDHVVVMRGGRVMADIDRDTPHFNSEDIMKAAWGGELD